MPDFAEFWKSLRDGLRQLVERDWRDYRDAALEDGEAFLTKTRADLERWATLLAGGQLSADEVAWLLQGKKDLALLQALRQAGLALVAQDRFRQSLLELLTSSLRKLAPVP